MNLALWIVQLLLAIFALLAGYEHGIVPLDQAAAAAPWIRDVPPALVRFIGWSELAAGIGLVLPAATRILPWLTPLAALGLALIMLLAIPFHIMRGEAHLIGMHGAVAALALFVAWGRGRRVPIRPATSRLR
jgi:putative oxidoreductase